jgi:hypothetical protein
MEVSGQFQEKAALPRESPKCQLEGLSVWVLQPKPQAVHPVANCYTGRSVSAYNKASSNRPGPRVLDSWTLVAGLCEHGDEHSGDVKSWEFIQYCPRFSLSRRYVSHPFPVRIWRWHRTREPPAWGKWSGESRTPNTEHRYDLLASAFLCNSGVCTWLESTAGRSPLVLGPASTPGGGGTWEK